MDEHAGRDEFFEHVFGSVLDLLFPQVNSHGVQSGRLQLVALRHWIGHGDEEAVELEMD
jgi:hypothetical protein